MRKLLTVLMAVLTFLCAVAIAFAQGDTPDSLGDSNPASPVSLTPYKNTKDGYQIGCPTDWLVLNEDTIDGLISDAQQGAYPALGEEALLQYKEQIDRMDMMLCTAADGSARFHVLYQPAAEPMTAEDVISTLVPGILDQYAQQLNGFNAMDTGTALTINGHTFARMGGVYLAQDDPVVISQLIYPSQDKLYFISFTLDLGEDTDILALQDITQAITASFSPAG